jgi:hypothetical protein
MIKLMHSAVIRSLRYTQQYHDRIDIFNQQVQGRTYDAYFPSNVLIFDPRIHAELNVMLQIDDYTL